MSSNALEIHNFNIGGPITAHAFNADRSKLAISKSSNVIEIYTRSANGEWALESSLADHDKLVTSIDWAPSSNRIVTCSQDRNANVWTRQSSGVWKPTLVLLRINRGATCVKWSPNEDKFAVASSARLIAICYFEPENDWWISKHLKKPIRSTVLSLDWHPNNVLLAAGSTDMRVRVFSAFIKDTDTRPAPTVWGERLPFNTLCFEANAAGWVHDVKFSPDGDFLAYVTHASSIHVAYPSGPESPPKAMLRIPYTGLPMTCLSFLTSSTFLAAGHNCAPVLFSGSESGWKETKSIDSKTSSKAAETDAFKSLRNNFRDMDVRGGASGDKGLSSVHQNTITSIRAYEGKSGSVSKVSTSGVDGKLVIWKV